MADLFDKEELGVVNSLFGTSPEGLAIAREQQAYKQGYSAGPNLIGGILGQTGMFAERGAQGLRQVFGQQSPEERLMGLRQQAQQQFDTNTPQGLAQAAQFLNQQGDAAGARQMVMLAQGQQLKQQQLATLQSQEVRNLREPNRTAMTQLIASGKYTPASIAAYQQSQNPADLVLTKGAPVEGVEGIGKLTPAQKAVDNKFSKEYTDFVSAGGSSAIAKNIKMLDDAIKIIEDAPDGDISGKLVGLADKTGTLSFTHPKAAEAKDLIGGVAQSNLRAILGGQFAAKEGEQLLARAYNTAQPKKDNLNRLKALRKQIEDAAQAKINASQYYEEKGTLKGFKGNYSVTPDLTMQDNNDPLGLRK